MYEKVRVIFEIKSDLLYCMITVRIQDVAGVAGIKSRTAIITVQFLLI